MSEAGKSLLTHSDTWEAIEVFLPSMSGSIHMPDCVTRFAYDRDASTSVCRILQRCAADVLRALAWILVSRLLGKRVPVIHDRVYRDYSLTASVMRASDLARRGRGRKHISSAQGEVYDLDRMFSKLNRKFFGGRLNKPTMTWSQRRTRSILGHHDHIYDSITISKTLDSEDVPEWFVEYILYHEMLHIKHPARLINGRTLLPYECVST
jgi:hypothetical protein